MLFSAALHGALVLALVDMATGGQALEEGTGNDLLRIEQGIALEGLTRLGDAPETVEAREVIETQASVAQPELEEVKAAEVKPEEEPPPTEVKPDKPPPEIKDVISSPLGPTQELQAVEPPPPEVKRPQPKQVATEEQVQQVAVLEQKAASQGQEGGDATAYRKFLGALSRHFEKFKLPQKVARGEKLESGKVVMVVEIDKLGGIVDAKVHSSSGSPRLDNLAVESVKRGQPYPVDAKFFPAETLRLEIPFIYSIRQ